MRFPLGVTPLTCQIDVLWNLLESCHSFEEGYEDKLIVKLPNRGDTVYTKVLINEDIDEINIY